MVQVEAAIFEMGGDSEWALPEEFPVHSVAQSAFWIDAHEVTNAEFQSFVAATGYVTTAEKPIPMEQIRAQLQPGDSLPNPEDLVPSSVVFRMPDPEAGTVGRWELVPGAQWRHPEGPGSSIEGRGNHPVVQVSWWDAKAYASWACKRLPTEAEWELAARGGRAQALFVWGDEPPGPEAGLLNMWQGDFPVVNAQADGFLASAPVGSFAPNGLGLFDMSGNVWEWCEDRFEARVYHQRDLQSPNRDPWVLPRDFMDLAPRSLRGGSFLCSDNYCTRYRPSARTGNTPDSATNHTGFRCVWIPSAGKTTP